MRTLFQNWDENTSQIVKLHSRGGGVNIIQQWRNIYNSSDNFNVICKLTAGGILEASNQHFGWKLITFIYFPNPYYNYLPHLFYKSLQLLIAMPHWQYAYFETFLQQVDSNKLLQLILLVDLNVVHNCSGVNLPAHACMHVYIISYFDVYLMTSDHFYY